MAQLCHRIGVMLEGRTGRGRRRRSQISRAPAHDYTRKLWGAIPQLPCFRPAAWGPSNERRCRVASPMRPTPTDAIVQPRGRSARSFGTRRGACAASRSRLKPGPGAGAGRRIRLRQDDLRPHRRAAWTRRHRGRWQFRGARRHRQAGSAGPHEKALSAGGADGVSGSHSPHSTRCSPSTIISQGRSLLHGHAKGRAQLRESGRRASARAMSASIPA